MDERAARFDVVGVGGQMEEMGWGTDPRKVLPYLPLGGRCEVLDDVGHFVHIEEPALVSRLVLDFLEETA